MANLTRALQELRQERSRAQQEVERLDEAISVVEGLVGRNYLGRATRSGRTARMGRRRFSAAARARMAAAARARWAKLKEKRSPKARRHMSASARNRIAAAQRARWAKLKEKQQKKAA